MKTWWEEQDPTLSVEDHAAMIAATEREGRLYRADRQPPTDFADGSDAFDLAILCRDLEDRLEKGRALFAEQPNNRAVQRKLAMLAADHRASCDTFEFALILYEGDPEHYASAYQDWLARHPECAPLQSS